MIRVDIQLDNVYDQGTHVLFQMIDVQVCIPPEDDQEIGSKHVVGKNKNIVYAR
jgi:hypothetical protein